MKAKAATTKLRLTDQEIEQIATKFKVLSESSRMKIVRSLVGGEKCVSDIIEETGLLQANVSKQLKLMLLHGVLSMRRAGLQRFYAISDPSIVRVCNTMCEKD